METSGTPAELALLSDLQHRQAAGAALEYLYFWDDPPAGPMPGRLLKALLRVRTSTRLLATPYVGGLSHSTRLSQTW